MYNFLFGDARFFWPENLPAFLRIPSSWDSSLNTGLGIPAVNTMWVTSYLHLSVLLGNIMHLNWEITNLIFWVLPTIILSFLSAYFLFDHLFPGKKLFAVISGIIYLSNTYFFMILLGGQQGVSLAYSVTPLVLLGFIKFYNDSKLYTALLFGLLASLQILFDPRIFFLLLIVIFLYIVVLFDKKKIRQTLSFIPVILVEIFLLHFYWIVPLLIFKFSSSVGALGIPASVKFFSFAQFEDAISLLHPNFPENIFGKVYFLKPEFLFLPILAFSSLLFIAKEKILTKKIILFFTLLAFVAAFLAKGTNEPFGQVYKFLFDYVPGFSLFRDPTKFYILISLAYSILISYSLIALSARLKQIKKIHFILWIVFIMFWIFSLRLLFNSTTFKSKKVPDSYVTLKNFIVGENSYFRTLWIPEWQRYGYFSDQNPGIGRYELLKAKTPEGMVRELQKVESEELLQETGVKYIIVPEDSESELFLTDRKYDDARYKKIVSALSRIPWLVKVKTFGKIEVFEISDPKKHFYILENEQADVNFKTESPTSYSVSLTNAKAGDKIIFAESFDRNWKLNSEGATINSEKYKLFNSFNLPKDGSYNVQIFFAPQKVVDIGILVSIVSWLIVSSSLFYLKVYNIGKT